MCPNSVLEPNCVPGVAGAPIPLMTSGHSIFDLIMRCVSLVVNDFRSFETEFDKLKIIPCQKGKERNHDSRPRKTNNFGSGKGSKGKKKANYG